MDRKELEKHNYIEQVKREVVIQSTLRHPRLLELYGYFCDEKSVYLILEHAVGGQLYTHLQKNRKFPEESVGIIVRQVL